MVVRTRFRDEADGSAAPWLYGIAYNVLLMSIRRGAVERRARERLGLQERLDRPEGLVAAVPEPVWADRADELLATLPPHQREAVRLRVLEDREYSDIARERPARERRDADRPAPRANFLRRPRVLAGGTLGLAGVGAALLLLLSAGGAAAAPPAFAITSQNDGSLSINLDSPGQGLVDTNNQLAKMGENEHIEFTMAAGPAASSGAVDCVASPQGANIAGPAITLTVGPGDSNTETIASGNTGAGTWHVASCRRFSGAETMHFVPGPNGSWRSVTTVGPRSASSNAAAVPHPRSVIVVK